MTADEHKAQGIDEWKEWDDWVENIPPGADLDGFEAELDQTIQEFDDIQADLSYQQAHFALSELVERIDLTEQERSGLETEIQQLQSMLQKLEQQVVHIAVFGMVSRGKSSLLNALVGAERTIVSDIAGTTRDTIHTHYKLFQKEFILIDTAGIRRKAKVHEDLEFYSVIRAIKAVDEADVCLLVLDAEKGIAAQDLNIFSLAAKKGKGIVVLVNKWDLVEKETNTAKDYEIELKKRFSPFSDVPILFVSAKEKTRIFKAIEKGLEVYASRQQKISTSELNEIMLKAIESYHPPVVRGHPIKIKFITQLPTAVPSFAFFCNFPDDIKQPYKNYLENKLRENFDFNGVPVRIFFRKK
jgi:GTP-binding protein